MLLYKQINQYTDLKNKFINEHGLEENIDFELLNKQIRKKLGDALQQLALNKSCSQKGIYVEKNTLFEDIKKYRLIIKGLDKINKKQEAIAEMSKKANEEQVKQLENIAAEKKLKRAINKASKAARLQKQIDKEEKARKAELAAEAYKTKMFKIAIKGVRLDEEDKKMELADKEKAREKFDNAVKTVCARR